ncbi:MAG: hypothetical protein AAGF12_16155 [Myxococcota bacterium]
MRAWSPGVVAPVVVSPNVGLTVVRSSTGAGPAPEAAVMGAVREVRLATSSDAPDAASDAPATTGALFLEAGTAASADFFVARAFDATRRFLDAPAARLVDVSLAVDSFVARFAADFFGFAFFRTAPAGALRTDARADARLFFVPLVLFAPLVLFEAREAGSLGVSAERSPPVATASFAGVGDGEGGSLPSSAFAALGRARALGLPRDLSATSPKPQPSSSASPSPSPSSSGATSSGGSSVSSIRDS